MRVRSVSELHLLWREKIEEYGGEEMLGKRLGDVEHEIHQRKKA